MNYTSLKRLHLIVKQIIQLWQKVRWRGYRVTHCQNGSVCMNYLRHENHLWLCQVDAQSEWCDSWAGGFMTERHQKKTNTQEPVPSVQLCRRIWNRWTLPIKTENKQTKKQFKKKMMQTDWQCGCVKINFWLANFPYFNILSSVDIYWK